MNGICFISAHIVPLAGGVQRQILLQSLELSKIGHKIFALQRENQTGTSEDLVKLNHVQLISIKMSRFKFLNPLFFILRGLIEFNHIKNEVGIVYVHQMSSATILGALIKIFYRKPLVVKVTSSGKWGEIRELRFQKIYFLRKIFFRFIDKWIALTSAMKSELQELLRIEGKNIDIIPNGVALGELKTSSCSGSSPFVILYLGRISIEKRLDTLIEAADLLSIETSSKVVVRLVGAVYPPRDPSHIIKNVKSKLKGDTHIEDLGNHDSVEHFYKTSNIFVLPSESEGMSNSLLEAMSAGLVCAASNIAENRVLIKPNETGVLFDVGDSKSLYIQLHRIFRDQTEDDGKFSREIIFNARALIEKNFSVKVVCSQISSLCESLSSKSYI